MKKLGILLSVLAFYTTDLSAQKLYVCEFSQNSIAVIDTTTDAQIGDPISLPASPAFFITSPDGSKAYVSTIDNQGVASVVVINTTDSSVGPILTGVGGDRPYCLAMSPDGRTIYAGGPRSEPHGIYGRLAVIDVATMTVVEQYDYDHEIFSLVITPDGKKVYLVANTVAVFDARYQANKLEPPIQPIPNTNNLNSSGPIAISPSGKTVYVTSAGMPPFMGGGILAIDTITHHVNRIDSPFNQPSYLTISADSSKVYVEDGGTRCVSVIDAKNHYAVTTLVCSVGPNIALGINPVHEIPISAIPLSGYSIPTAPLVATSDGTKAYVMSAIGTTTSLVPIRDPFVRPQVLTEIPIENDSRYMAMIPGS